MEGWLVRVADKLTFDMHKFANWIDTFTGFDKNRGRGICHLIERASGRNLYERGKDTFKKNITINLKVLRERAYYYAGLKKKEVDDMIEAMGGCI